MSALNLNEQEGPQVQTFEQIEKERDARRRKITFITCVVLLIIVWILAMLLWYLWKSRPEPLPPPTVGQTQDAAVQEETPDPPPEEPVEEKKEPDVVIALIEGTVEIRTEPTLRPAGDVMYQLVASDAVLAQSGRLKEGEPLVSMELVSNITEIIAPGEYEAVFWCIFYGEDGGMEMEEGETLILSVVRR